jgi:hypothetical protein
VFGRRNKPSPCPAAVPAFIACERCQGGDPDARCRCDAVDRCSETDSKGHQCMLGAGHSLKHVTATGDYWQ